jgi:hypothetical protein
MCPLAAHQRPVQLRHYKHSSSLYRPKAQIRRHCFSKTYTLPPDDKKNIEKPHPSSYGGVPQDTNWVLTSDVINHVTVKKQYIGPANISKMKKSMWEIYDPRLFAVADRTNSEDAFIAERRASSQQKPSSS